MFMGLASETCHFTSNDDLMNCVFLDDQSTKDIFCNAHFVENIHSVNTDMTVHINGGSVTITQMFQGQYKENSCHNITAQSTRNKQILNKHTKYFWAPLANILLISTQMIGQQSWKLSKRFFFRYTIRIERRFKRVL